MLINNEDSTKGFLSAMLIQDIRNPDALKVRRKNLGLAAWKLASLSGCSTNTLEKYECGVRPLTPKIEQAFITLDKLEKERQWTNTV